ncbi:MBL fold metallo-hydrolase [Magnetovirga frankeli]|uniref:MBL fold metallo-hydrolase RNA specificity domain-containing protein n=1 Tax=Magnetovirga frankeli TaxID=947516 RepID=UPI001293DEC6|nr:MBL fold metallo-hydrolase [gamma proteobacterium SS-5]
MQILHHGAVDGVTGSCHQLMLDDSRSLLIDCGLFQGAEAGPDGSGADRLAIDFPIDQVRALVITHVHIDHVGRLPYLLAAGYRGPIFCSPSSAELLPLVLEDALKIGVTRNRKLIEQVLAVLRQRTQAIPFGQWHELEPGIALRLQRAGHILGSAYVECQLEGQRVVFSGDLGAPNTPLLPAPEPPEQADVLVLESTYGDRLHEDRSQRALRLRRVIEHALKDGGTVLIPAFSVGRTQELLYELEGLFHQHGEDGADAREAWQQLQVVLDSPLAADFTAGYRRLRQFWDEEAQQRLAEGRHPLDFEQLVTVDSHTDHQRMVNYLAHSRQAALVIAASGMCAGGRMVNYLKAMLGDPRHDVLFVGYQAAGTPGRAIQQYGPRGGYVVLDDQRYEIRAQIHTIGGYSAHADQQDLINFASGMAQPPKEIRLVHGDAGAKSALAQRLRAALPETQVLIP